MYLVCLLLTLLTVTVNIYGVPPHFGSRHPHNAYKDLLYEDGSTSCGYDSCHPIQPGMLNVHIVPHTHDDVGWLKTVDQYYFGSKSRTQQAGVQYILDSVIQELMKDPNKRFIYVETAFFWKWWKRQHDTLRHQVVKLVNRGQLEFIGGAWSMNDEAVTHYQSIIDQFTWGLRKLNETFGKCGKPKIGWQIDPFGHSREMASIFAQLGFDGLLFGRLDYQDKANRLDTKTMEMVWRGSNSLGNSSDLFTSVLFNTYSPPPGFCFDILCADDPIIDDKRSPEYNLDTKVSKFLKFAQNQSLHYHTKNIIITMGEDFNYQDAHMWYTNLDKIIRYANSLQENGSKFNLLYSTPSCYLKAVHDEDKDRQWLVKTDDFFPYASDPNSYWTGYFSSRPTIKRFERLGNNFLQVCKQLYALTDLGPEDWVDLNTMREAMGVLQHHDAITGTEKEHVAHDYARILTQGIVECEIAATTALNKIMTSKTPRQEEAPKLNLESCLHLNVSQCAVSENSDSFVVTLYNPLSRSVSQYVRLPVTGKSYTVTDPNGVDLTVQLIPIPDQVLKIPGRISSATVELIFHASDLPPLGYKSYYVRKGNVENMVLREDLSDTRNHLSNGNLRVQLDPRTGLVSYVKINELDIPLYQDFLWYEGKTGNNAEFKNRSSGAYIFRPVSENANSLSDNVKTKVFKGPLSKEIHLVFTDWCSQVIRIYEQENYLEFEWLIGPIPVEDKAGKEVITRYRIPLKNDGKFYTDSNGREVLQRIRNYRPTWNVVINEFVSGNYYPVTSKIAIRDEAQGIEVAVLTDRAQGGSSLKDGEIELMVHRRLLHDDSFGVGEALNETAFGVGLVARGQHYIMGGYTKNTRPSIAAMERDLAQRKLLAAWTFLSPVQLSYQQYKNSYVMQYAGLKQSLPKNVQILTLEPWKAASFLLRLEHVLEKNEDPDLSQPVIVDIKNIFSPFDVKSVRETTLGGNEWLDENQRLKWRTADSTLSADITSSIRSVEKSTMRNDHQSRKTYKDTNEIPESGDRFAIESMSDEDYKYYVQPELSSFQFTLQPMQIRTFVIDIEKL